MATHDRLGHRRRDDAWIAETWQHPDTRILLVSGGRMRAVDRRPEWLTGAEVAPTDGTPILLGDRGEGARFALYVEEPDGAGWAGLRELGGAFLADPDEVGLLFHAVGMAEWHHRTRFCARCGGALESRQAGHVKVCTACGREQFPRIEPAVIMIVAHGEPGSPEERCLLGRGVQWEHPRFSTLAGFAEPGESLEDAVRREVFEEAGIRVGEVEWFGNQSWPFPSSLMLGFVARAETTEINVDPEELADARWFTRAELEAQAASGEVRLPPRGVSISRFLIEHWHGGELPGHWFS